MSFRVITLSNGLRALLISDQQSACLSNHESDPNSLPKHLAGTEAAELPSMQDQSPAQCEDVNGADTGNCESDDGDSSWTDVSSDGEYDDLSPDSAEDCKASDYSDSFNCNDGKRLGRKRKSRSSHSASNIHSCNAEKLVRIVYQKFIIFCIFGK